MQKLIFLKKTTLTNIKICRRVANILKTKQNYKTDPNDTQLCFVKIRKIRDVYCAVQQKKLSSNYISGNFLCCSKPTAETVIKQLKIKKQVCIMDYRDKVFLAVAENLSFSKASEELFISQPAVTKHIKELESKLNSTLFERKGNRVYLTEAGKLTCNYLKKIRQQYEELEFELGRMSDTFKGTLRIGASSTISQYLIPKVIAAFHRRYPKIELFLFNGNSFEMEQNLLENKIEIALVENDSSQSNIKYIEFLDDEIVLVTGSQSAYAKLKSISLIDFEQIPVVLREKGSGTLEVIHKQLIKYGTNLDKLNILIHLGSTEAIKNFLCDFDGVALVSEKSIEKELLLKQIKKINIKGINFNRKFRIAFRQGEQALSSKLFAEFLSNYNF
ncbi:MAG: LysR substrate-binding domain-containing protein [Bacteroidales bacterium]|nr:LysR substrate-binding domain-containing protein [Bacteroidales bacterium]MDD2426264.1 LysR substrate-binding domain-containing protein [Bacteroidales bacterium]MDD4638612.1 LysR substrate-binding domain-containing protein [Bacteroidales bacterium]